MKLSFQRANFHSIQSLLEILVRLRLDLNHNTRSNITKQQIYYLCDKPSPIIIREFIEEFLNRNLRQCITLIQKLKDDGYQSSDICITLNNEIINSQCFDEMQKRRLMMIIGEYNLLFLEGNDSYLMIGGMICEMFS